MPGETGYRLPFCFPVMADFKMSTFKTLSREVETERLVLRPLEADDAHDIQFYASDREVASMTANIPHPYRDGAAEEFIEDVARRHAAGEEIGFAICRTERRDRLIGVIGIRERPDGDLELGYWLAKPFWRRGLMSEAVPVAVAIARRWKPDARVVARTIPENAGSRAVLKKVGFVQQGTEFCNTPARDCDGVTSDLFVLEGPR